MAAPGTLEKQSQFGREVGSSGVGSPTADPGRIPRTFAPNEPNCDRDIFDGKYRMHK